MGRLENIEGMCKIVVRVLLAVDFAEVAEEGGYLVLRTNGDQAGDRGQKPRWISSPIDTPASCCMPSSRNRVWKRMTEQKRTSSSRSLWGSKFQVSRDLIRRLRVFGGMSSGELGGSQIG